MSRLGLGALAVPLNPDARLLFATRAMRLFGNGLLSVLLAIYLAGLGLETTQIGAIFSATLGGGAVLTVLFASLADRVGRRRILAIGALLVALSSSLFASSTAFPILLVAAALGAVSPSAADFGPSLSIEQTILPQTCPPERRTMLFSWYNLSGNLAAALGSLAAGVPVVLGPAVGLDFSAAYRLLLALYTGLALAQVLLFLRLSPAAELQPSAERLTGAAPGPMGSRARRPGSFLALHRSRGRVLHLSALFGFDALAGGMVVNGLIAYWFYLRFGTSSEALSTIFFVVSLLTGLSFLAAAKVAERIGLINTMVVTHLPSNVLLLAIPLMPTFELAVGVLFLRVSLAQMDIPARQSYTMAIVDPDERAAAAGLTNVSRNVGHAFGPALAGVAMQTVAFGLPFLVGGALKAAYDLVLFASFRQVRPAEEVAAARRG